MSYFVSSFQYLNFVNLGEEKIYMYVCECVYIYVNGLNGMIFFLAH